MDQDHADDPSIRNWAELWRWIHPKQFVLDENLKRMRPSSAAFKDSSDGTPMSVDRAKVLAAIGRDEYSILRNFPGEALAAFTARLARRLNQGVEPNPLLENPAHTYIFGDKPKGTVRAFAKNSVWVVEPDKNKQVHIPEQSDPNRLVLLEKRILRAVRRLRAKFSAGQ